MITLTIISPFERRTVRISALSFTTGVQTNTWLTGHEPALALIAPQTTLALYGVEGTSTQENIFVAQGGLCHIERTVATAVLYGS